MSALIAAISCVSQPPLQLLPPDRAGMRTEAAIQTKVANFPLFPGHLHTPVHRNPFLQLSRGPPTGALIAVGKSLLCTGGRNLWMRGQLSAWHRLSFTLLPQTKRNLLQLNFCLFFAETLQHPQQNNVFVALRWPHSIGLCLDVLNFWQSRRTHCNLL